MVSATTEFIQAALHLHRVYQEQQRSRQISRETRAYYREQKARTLAEFSRYEFLFSESYRRLRESGYHREVPYLFNPEITNLIRTGQSYEDTYQEIALVFDRKIREATRRSPIDPDFGNADKVAEKYQADIEKIMKSYATRIIELASEGKGINEIIIETEAIKPDLMSGIKDVVKSRITAAVDAGSVVAGTYLSNLIKSRG